MHRNAVILAAGTASRFVPLSQEIPKGLLEVKGEILIERQICQLKEAGVSDICVVVGYKAEMFGYLKDKFGVELVYNEDYARYNNTSSMIRVLDRLGNTYICSSDNYFQANVFASDPDTSFYSALYAHGYTGEYCILTDESDNIRKVSVGGSDSWYMIGHVYFSEDFSRKFCRIMATEYAEEATRLGYWEDVYIRHIDSLPYMRINRYGENEIKEFDSLDELREFDSSYINDTRSSVIKGIAARLGCTESSLAGFRKAPHSGGIFVFSFTKGEAEYMYDGEKESLTRI